MKINKIALTTWIIIFSIIIAIYFWVEREIISTLLISYFVLMGGVMLILAGRLFYETVFE